MKRITFIFAALFIATAGVAHSEDATGVDTMVPTSVPVTEKKNLSDIAKERKLDIYETVSKLVDSISFTDEVISQPDIYRVALFHNPENIDTRLPKDFYPHVEQALVKKLISTKRFQLVKCMECGTVHVNITNEKFTIQKSIDTNTRMAEIAETLRLDGLLIWNVTVHPTGRIFLDMHLVDGKTGTITWAKNFDDKTVVVEMKKAEEERMRKEFHFTAYTGMWGFKVDRTLVAGGTPDTMGADRFLVLGSKMINYSTVSDSVGYGVGMELFSNVINMSYANIYGADFFGEISIHLDQTRVSPESQIAYSVYNWYITFGEAYINGNIVEILKSGLEFRFNEKYSFAFGMVYLPKRHVWLVDNSNYTKGGDVGGLTYDFSLGINY